MKNTYIHKYSVYLNLIWLYYYIFWKVAYDYILQSHVVSACIKVFASQFFQHFVLMDALHFLKKAQSRIHFFLSAFWDPVIRLSYSLLFHILLIKRASATPFGSLCVLLESYHCFAFLCLHLPSCMLLKYKSTWYTFCWSISPLYNNSLSNEG